MTKVNNVYEIEKDKYLNCWIVWEVHTNYKIDKFQGKTKKECKEWLENNNQKKK